MRRGTERGDARDDRPEADDEDQGARGDSGIDDCRDARGQIHESQKTCPETL